MNQRKSLAIFMALMLVSLSTVMVTAPVPASAAPPPQSGSLTTSIMQVIAGVGTFAGTLTVNSFTLVNGAVNAVGTVTGTLTDAAGNVLASVTNQPVSIPITSFTGTCGILNLHTGAITLSLLGLNVSLSPIDLVITATAAPGNLLGNLLCSVAHLLDTNASLNALIAHLNSILGAL
jgi:hypothetical protein